MTSAAPQDLSLRPVLWMLAGALGFAGMGGFAHALGSRCDWLVIGLVRAAFMFVAMVLWARASHVRLVVFHPPTLWVRSIAGSVSLVCNFFALTRLPVADAITISNIYPLWIVLLTALWLRQPPTLREFLGVVSGLAGVALIQRPHLGGDRFAVLVAVFSSVSTALAMLGLHRLKGIDARAIMAHFAGVSSLIAGLWLLAKPEALSPEVLEPGTLGMLLGVCVTGTFGQFCLTKAYAAGPPSRVSVVGLSQVVFAMAIDVLLLGTDPLPLDTRRVRPGAGPGRLADRPRGASALGAGPGRLPNLMAGFRVHSPARRGLSPRPSSGVQCRFEREGNPTAHLFFRGA